MIEDIRHQNQVIGRACKDFPERFPLGLALVEPRFGKLGIEEVEKAMSDLGLVGLVGHPPIGEWCIPFVEAAATRKGLCNLHLHDHLMLRVAKLFPAATFIVHASTAAIESMAGLDNVWFEVVQYPDGQGSSWRFDWMAGKAGKERLVFGADLPYYDYRVLQRTIEEAPVGDDLKERIAFQNAETLIRSFRPDWRLPSEPPVAPRRYAADELWASNPKNPVRLTVYA